jgi:hypothetical protein
MQAIQYLKSKIPERRTIFKVYLTFVLFGAFFGFSIIANAHYNYKPQAITTIDSTTNERNMWSVKQQGCLRNADCNNGICIQAIPPVCQCNQGFTNFGGTCNYQQKSGLVAFLLSFFIGIWGADWYLQKNKLIV